MKFLFMPLLALCALHCSAAAAVQSELHVDFQVYARRALADLKRLGLSDEIHLRELEEIRQGSEVEPSDLELRPGERPADHLVDTDVISRRMRINENRWRNTQDERVRKAVALHQLRRLLFLEDDTTLDLSSRYLVALGFRGSAEKAIRDGSPQRLPDTAFAAAQAYAVKCTRRYRYRDERRPGAPLREMLHAQAGNAVDWTDGSKRYSLGVFDPRTQEASGRMYLQLSRALRTESDTLDEVNFRQTSRSFVAGAKGQLEERLFRYAGQRRFPEPGEISDHGRTEGFAQENHTVLRHRADGSFTSDSRQLSDGQRLGPWTLIDFGVQCEERPVNGKGAPFFKRALLAAIRRFSEAHRITLEQKKAWYLCESESGADACTAEAAAYRQADVARDALWEELVPKELLRKSLRIASPR